MTAESWEYKDNPFPDYELVVEDYDYDYSWSVTVVLYKDGRYYTASDVGCSCYGPWEDVSQDDIVPAASFAEAIKGLSSEAKERAIRWGVPRVYDY